MVKQETIKIWNSKILESKQKKLTGTPFCKDYNLDWRHTSKEHWGMISVCGPEGEWCLQCSCSLSFQGLDHLTGPSYTIITLGLPREKANTSYKIGQKLLTKASKPPFCFLVSLFLCANGFSHLSSKPEQRTTCFVPTIFVWGRSS